MIAIFGMSFGQTGHLWDVIRVDRNLVVPLQDVQLTENASAMEVGCYVSHVRQRVVVGFSDHVKTTIITAGLPEAVIFLGKVKGGGPWARRFLT